MNNDMDKTTINILKDHIAMYPLMEVRDVCKLIYQSIFGGGHMIKDPMLSLNRLKEEYETQYHNLEKSKNPVEHIGNGVSRICLRVLKDGMDFHTLNQMFVLSANRKKGSFEQLEESLTTFLKECEKKTFSYDLDEAKQFIEKWKEAGYPAISHSEGYRSNYNPAYRVVDTAFAQYYEVFLAVDRLLKKEENSDRPLIIAIEGMAGSGKSTLGALLKEIYSCNLFHMDDYFLQPHQRTKERLSEPGGNVDYERFKKEIHDKISQQEDFVYQVYDCSKQALGDKIQVKFHKDKRLNLIEGAYSAHPYFEDRADLVIFMEVSCEVQKERIRARNGEWMLNRFLNEWIPMEHCYFEHFHIREKSNLIINNKE